MLVRPPEQYVGVTRLSRLTPAGKVLPGKLRADPRAEGGVIGMVSDVEAYTLLRCAVLALLVGIAPRGQFSYRTGHPDGFRHGLPGAIAAHLNPLRHRGLLSSVLCRSRTALCLRTSGPW